MSNLLPGLEYARQKLREQSIVDFNHAPVPGSPQYEYYLDICSIHNDLHGWVFFELDKLIKNEKERYNQ